MRIAVVGVLGAFVWLGVMAVRTGANAQLDELVVKEPKVEAGEVEVEYIGDHYFGQPRRRFIETSPGSLLFDDNGFNRQRHTLGVGYGLSKWLSVEFAVEAEQARFEDADTIARATAFDALKVRELELEGTAVLIPARKDGFAAAAPFQYKKPVDAGEADRLYLGTALQYAQGPWSATANLYAVKLFGGREEDPDGAAIRDERWDFQYAAQVKYRLNDSLALGLEGFGVVERLGNSGAKSRAREVFGDFDRHLWGPTLYYSWSAEEGGAAKTGGKSLRVRATGAGGKTGDDEENGAADSQRYSFAVGVLLGSTRIRRMSF